MTLTGNETQWGRASPIQTKHGVTICGPLFRKDNTMAHPKFPDSSIGVGVCFPYNPASIGVFGANPAVWFIGMWVSKDHWIQVMDESSSLSYEKIAARCEAMNNARKGNEMEAAK